MHIRVCSVVSQPSFPEFFSEDWINGYGAETLGSLRCIDLCRVFFFLFLLFLCLSLYLADFPETVLWR